MDKGREDSQRSYVVTLRFARLGSERYPDMLRRRKEDAYGDRSAPQSPSSDVMVLLEDGTEGGIFVRDSGCLVNLNRGLATQREQHSQHRPSRHRLASRASRGISTLFVSVNAPHFTNYARLNLIYWVVSQPPSVVRVPDK